MLLAQLVVLADSRAWAKTGNRIAASIAIIAITTRSSISVNAFAPLLRTTKEASYDCSSSSSEHFLNDSRRRTGPGWVFMQPFADTSVARCNEVPHITARLGQRSGHLREAFRFSQILSY